MSIDEKKANRVRAIMIVALAASLLVSLIFIIWQNFFVPKASVVTTSTVTESQNIEASLPPTISVAASLARPAYSQQPASAGDFGNIGAYGSFHARGYAAVAERYKPNPKGFYLDCTDSTCEKVDYVIFNILKTENSNVAEYLGYWSENNAWISRADIGLGCLVNGTINYYNISDAVGYKQYTINASETAKILASSLHSPINLNVNKWKYSGGSEAPTCYSDFTEFAVVN